MSAHLSDSPGHASVCATTPSCLPPPISSIFNGIIWTRAASLPEGPAWSLKFSFEMVHSASAVLRALPSLRLQMHPRLCQCVKSPSTPDVFSPLPPQFRLWPTTKFRQ